MRWYVSDIIAINKLINTITDTSKYVPKIILKKPSVHDGRKSGIGLISSFVVCPNTAKKRRSNATTGVIGPLCFNAFFVFVCFWSIHHMGWEKIVEISNKKKIKFNENWVENSDVELHRECVFRRQQCVIIHINVRRSMSMELI